jgi:hypothetical protein
MSDILIVTPIHEYQNITTSQTKAKNDECF